MVLKGGEFLIKQSDADSIFIPEEWNEEQRMIAQSAQEFLDQEVFPNLDRIDSLEEGLMPSLLDKAGELGLLGISIKTGSFKHNATILAIRSGESNGFDGIIEDYIENPYSGVTNTMTHTEREILTVPFSGAYRLSDKFSFDWKFAPSVVRVRDIDFRKSVFNVLNNGNKIIDNSSTALPLRLWRDLEEYGVSAKADLTSSSETETALK